MNLHAEEIKNKKKQFDSEIKRMNHFLEKEKKLAETISEKHKK